MRAFTATSLVALLSAALSPAAFGVLTTGTVIDFEFKSNGDAFVVSEQITDQIDGLKFSYSSTDFKGRNYTPTSSPNNPLIFNSNNLQPGSNDTDLLSSPVNAPGVDLGNIAIIDSDGSAPSDDSAHGGVIRIEFEHAVTFTGIELMDIDRNEKVKLIAKFEDGSIDQFSRIRGIGDRKLITRDNYSIENVKYLDVAFSGSGALAAFSFMKPVPEPATIIAIGTFFIIGLAAWRRFRRS